MRIRCIAFLLPAALVTALIFLFTSSIVSALEARFIQGRAFATIEIVRHETDCEFLERRIELVAADLRSCQALPGCLESKNICPAAMLDEYTQEYGRLRKDVLSRCSDLPTYAIRVSAACLDGTENCEAQRCTLSAGSIGVGPSSARPGVFLF